MPEVRLTTPLLGASVRITQEGTASRPFRRPCTARRGACRSAPTASPRSPPLLPCPGRLERGQALG
eukprot:7383092-Prymnesium_polylepis.1